MPKYQRIAQVSSNKHLPSRKKNCRNDQLVYRTKLPSSTVKLGKQDRHVRRSRVVGSKGSVRRGSDTRRAVRGQASRRLDQELDGITRRQVGDGVGVDALVAVKVHRLLLQAVEVELGKVLLGDHGQADLLLVVLLLLGGDLQLRGVEVHEVGLDVWLLLLLLLRLLRLRLRWLVGRGALHLLLRLLLRHAKDGRVLADVVDERGEGWVAEEGFDQAAVAVVLLHESVVLLAETVALLGLDGDFSFKLGDVFWCKVSK